MASVVVGQPLDLVKVSTALFFTPFFFAALAPVSPPLPPSLRSLITYADAHANG